MQVKKKDVGEAILFVALVPVVTCLTFTYFGGTSPGYSYYVHVFLVILASVGLGNILGQRFRARRVYLSAVKRVMQVSCVTIFVYGIIAYGVFRSVSRWGDVYQDVGERSDAAFATEYDVLLGSLFGGTTRPYEQRLTFPSGVVGVGDYLEGRVAIPVREAAAYRMTFYLWRTVKGHQLDEAFRCVVTIEDEVKWEGRLSELFNARWFGITRESPGETSMQFQVRLIFEGDEAIRVSSDENVVEAVGCKFLFSNGIAVGTKDERQDVPIGLGGQGVGTVGGHQLSDAPEQLTQGGPTPEEGEALPDQARRGGVAAQVGSVASRTRLRVLDRSTPGLLHGVDAVPDGALDDGRRGL